MPPLVVLEPRGVAQPVSPGVAVPAWGAYLLSIGVPRDLPQPCEEPAWIHSSLRSAKPPQVLPAR